MCLQICASDFGESFGGRKSQIQIAHLPRSMLTQAAPLLGGPLEAQGPRQRRSQERKVLRGQCPSAQGMCSAPAGGQPQ